MKIHHDPGGIVLSEIDSDLWIETPSGNFKIEQRDDGIEVLKEGKTVWSSEHPDAEYAALSAAFEAKYKELQTKYEALLHGVHREAKIVGVSLGGREDFTLRELQTNLPWTTHYHRDFRASSMAHKDFGHALLHVVKATGKLAEVINNAEHKGSEFTSGDVDPYVADLVICALRMANTCPNRTIDLQQAVEKRIEMKNGVTLERKQG